MPRLRRGAPIWALQVCRAHPNGVKETNPRPRWAPPLRSSVSNDRTEGRSGGRLGFFGEVNFPERGASPREHPSGPQRGAQECLHSPAIGLANSRLVYRFPKGEAVSTGFAEVQGAPGCRYISIEIDEIYRQPAANWTVLPGGGTPHRGVVAEGRLK